ncbi:ATP-binding cassette domain-containing protein [Lyngbya aestuarii]|uniref:ATP-binding cassette domain-containing protein n=1 Tax=Lyngbya aestuarii TaxID=118322 RepID=UPI00403DD603
MINYISRVFYILGGKKKQIILLMFLFLLTSMLEVFGVGLIGPFMTIATSPEVIHQSSWSNWLYTQLNFRSEISFLSVLGLLIVGILSFKSLVGFIVQKYIFGFGFGEQADLRLRLMSAYLRVPYTFHISGNTALLIQNIVSETLNFANGVLMPTLFAVANFTVVCALVLLLLKTSLTATLSILVVLSLLSLFLYQFKNKISYWGRESSDASQEIIRVINHGMGGLKETRIIGCETYFENQMSKQALRYKTAVEDFHAFSLLPRYLLEPILIIFLVGFTITSLIYSEQNSQNLTGTLGVFAMASIRLLPAVSNLMQSFSGIKKHTYVVDRLYLDLKNLEEIESAQFNHNQLPGSGSDNSFSHNHSNKQAIPFKKEITLDEIAYRYPNTSEYAIQDISLSINKGQSIGLIGKSGAGKTTLVDVILGLLTIESGDLKVDGVSVINNLRNWQNLIGYIPQSIFLIDDTLERNIAFGVPDNLIDKQKLEKAIKLAQLTEVVSKLPDGVETSVGERGVLLSGGQRQRIGIARALYHEREILVLDEATSALDNETETLVTEAIKSLSGTKTMIIIAHRLTTVEHCNRIYLMDKGRVVESGSYQEVVLKDYLSSN